MSEARCAAHVLRLKRRRFDYNCHNRIPQGIGGLYAFWLSSGACLYVGKSNNLGRRLYQHRMQEHNDKLASYLKSFAEAIEVSHVTSQDCNGADVTSLEMQLIHTLRPLTNILKPT